MTLDLERKYNFRLEELRAELIEQIYEGTKNATQFLSCDAFDNKLAEFVVLNDGTPRGLADFASADDYHMVLVEQLLDDTTLMKQILLADGAKALPNGPAQYGPAMKIYTEILSRTERVSWGGSDIFSRLALAIALEHAVPIEQNNPKAAASDRETHVDPVKRYLNYETAYLNGELDPDFATLTTWELRFVIDGNEPDEISAWGRTMLRNYRPDHVLERRYVRMVNSNIRYGSRDVIYDKDELQQYQNILMNGGVCGRRAFFGRFILRAFGVPTTARPSRGHGALVHWTSNGWVVALGGNWGCGWTKTLYHKDLDFLATTQARMNESEYWKVKRAQWFGDVMGEQRVYGEHDKAMGQLEFWYNESLKTQRAIIDDFPDKNAIPRPQPGTYNRQLTIIELALSTPIHPDTNKIMYRNDSKLITIPAASYQNPRHTKDVQIMPCFQGGRQIYLPAFASQGLTIMRGGTWKNDSNGCCSGVRIMSGGFGKYEDWGFRVAISGNEDTQSCPSETLTIDIDDSGVKMEFIYIKPGSFQMGGESTSDGRFQCVELPKHQVRISKGFYLGKYPVTQAQYTAVMPNNPSKSTKAPNCPVDNIGEQDALDFCAKLIDKIGRDFRLPTEAEWEYACRAGQGDKKWFFGDDPSKLHEYAWFKENSGGKSHPVGQKKPNPFGLYDIYGNVYERVSDKYEKDFYANSPLIDPTGPIQGTKSAFEYTVRVPHQGTYKLVGEVVTANEKQRLNVRANDNKSSEIVMEMPFTNGHWKESCHVLLLLQEGENTICFWRDEPPQYGLAIRKFTLELDLIELE